LCILGGISWLGGNSGKGKFACTLNVTDAYGGWCARRDIQSRRGRPYKKDDNAHIEQRTNTT